MNPLPTHNSTPALPRLPDSGTGRRIVLTTFGSLGDLHPYLAVALGLKARGHSPVLATMDYYQRNVEAAGLEFIPIRPEAAPFLDDPETFKKLLDSRKGTENILKDFVFPHLRDSYEDLKAAIVGADLLVSHPLTFAAPILAEQTDIAWASVTLSPLGMLSAYDLPVFANAPGLSKMRMFGPTGGRIVLTLGRQIIRSWSAPILKFRAELGLGPGRNPMFEGQFSPALELALFSPTIAPPQPDWPPNTVQTGFVFYDRLEGEPMPPALAEFLSSGPPPIVFTLGSSAVMGAGDFYEVSARVAKRMNRRAVLLTGREAGNVPHDLPPTIVAFDYAPYSEVFPKAAIVVHSGGIGSTAQVLRAGKPSLIMPFANDQFDNAARVKRIGVGRSIPRSEYNTLNTSAELFRLLNDPPFGKRAAAVGKIVQEEDGVKSACDALEALLRTKASR